MEAKKLRHEIWEEVHRQEKGLNVKGIAQEHQRGIIAGMRAVVTIINQMEEEEKAQQEFIKTDGELLEPVIKEIQAGNYTSLKIELKTREGIEFNFKTHKGENGE